MTSNRLEKFLTLLGKAHAAQKAPEPSGAFEQNVMRRIRQASQELPAWMAWQTLVMRVAAASVVAAVLMVGIGVQQGLTPSYEVAEAMLELQAANSVTLADFAE